MGNRALEAAIKGLDRIAEKGHLDKLSSVDPGKLDMSIGTRCVLGQMFGHYSTGLDKLDVGYDTTQGHGFAQRSGDFTSAELKHAWTHIIRILKGESSPKRADGTHSLPVYRLMASYEFGSRAHGVFEVTATHGEGVYQEIFPLASVLRTTYAPGNDYKPGSVWRDSAGNVFIVRPDGKNMTRIGSKDGVVSHDSIKYYTNGQYGELGRMSSNITIVDASFGSN